MVWCAHTHTRASFVFRSHAAKNVIRTETIAKERNFSTNAANSQVKFFLSVRIQAADVCSQGRGIIFDAERAHTQLHNTHTIHAPSSVEWVLGGLSATRTYEVTITFAAQNNPVRRVQDVLLRRKINARCYGLMARSQYMIGMCAITGN